MTEQTTNAAIWNNAKPTDRRPRPPMAVSQNEMSGPGGSEFDPTKPTLVLIGGDPASGKALIADGYAFRYTDKQTPSVMDTTIPVIQLNGSEATDEDALAAYDGAKAEAFEFAEALLREKKSAVVVGYFYHGRDFVEFAELADKYDANLVWQVSNARYFDNASRERHVNMSHLKAIRARTFAR